MSTVLSNLMSTHHVLKRVHFKTKRLGGSGYFCFPFFVFFFSKCRFTLCLQTLNDYKYENDFFLSILKRFHLKKVRVLHLHNVKYTVLQICDDL